MLAALLGAALLASCGNNPYPSRERDKPLVYAWLTDDPKTLDPSKLYNIPDGRVAACLYTSFFQFHYLKRDPFELQLALGAEMPRRERLTVTDADGRPVNGERWTFRIRRGLRFQDDPCFPGGKGREIRASDFLHSFKRMADPALNCPILPLLTDKVIGLGEYYERQRALSKAGKGLDYSVPVAGLELDPRDPYVFRVVLNQPYPQLRYLMAMVFTTPLAPEATSRYGTGLGKHPVGSGPYVLAEWQPKQRLLLLPNPNYRREDVYPSDGRPEDRTEGRLEDAGAPLPLNGGVVFNILREQITAWNFFQQGYLDAFGVTQENYRQAVSQAGTITPEMAAKGVTLSKSTGLTFNYFAFNMQDPVVGGYDERRKKLRQALSLAYDSRAELDLMNAGLGVPGQWVIPPGVAGYEPDYRNPYRQPDLERAKRLLAEAGYPGGVDRKTGKRLTLTYDNNATTAAGRQFVGLVQKQFEQIGVRVESRSWRFEVWDERMDKGQFQMLSYGWVGDYPDPENFVFTLYGPNMRPGPNATGYDRPEYNRLFERMRSMDDGPQREALLRQMRDLAVEDCPYIYRSHDEALSLTYSWYGNVVSHPVALDIYKYRKIDAPRRAELQTRWNRPNLAPIVAALLLLVGGSIPAVTAARRRARRSARRRG